MSTLSYYKSILNTFKAKGPSNMEWPSDRPLDTVAQLIARFEHFLDETETFEEALSLTVAFYQKNPLGIAGNSITKVTEEELLKILDWYNEEVLDI